MRFYGSDQKIYDQFFYKPVTFSSLQEASFKGEF